MEIRFNVSCEEYRIFVDEIVKAKRFTSQHNIELISFDKHFKNSLNSEMVGYFDDGKLIGVAWCPINDNDEVTIADIIVHPTFTKKGVGRGIVEAIIKKYSDEYLIFAYPLDNNAKEFLIKIGFVKDDLYYPDERQMVYKSK